MKYVQINSFYNGSTGTIMQNLHKQLLSQGVDSYIFWGRRHETINERERIVGTPLGIAFHGCGVRLTDRMGFFSKRDTAKLLKIMDEIDPDVVHLHNIHGYYLNIEMLFTWLKNHRCKVKWTLHDCWAFTGHCAYFTYVGCRQWKTQCAASQHCPQLGTYPSTLNKTNCSRNFEDKKRLFTSIPIERMQIITPSNWLKGLVEESFLGIYSVVVQRNTIDCRIFKPMESNFRFDNGIYNRFMVLGVASPWTERKGLPDLIKLYQKVDHDEVAIVIVGLSEKQIADLPAGIIGLPRTKSAKELAEIYSTADILFNPTLEDNYPTVNLESEACGTPVVTYDVGGCAETIKHSHSCAVRGFDEAYDVINKMINISICHK